MYAKATSSQTTNMYKHKTGCLTNLHFPVLAIDTPKIQSMLGAPSLLGFQSPPGSIVSFNLHLPQPILGVVRIASRHLFFSIFGGEASSHKPQIHLRFIGRKNPNRMERCCWTRRLKNLSNRCHHRGGRWEKSLPIFYHYT